MSLKHLKSEDWCRIPPAPLPRCNVSHDLSYAAAAGLVTFLGKSVVLNSTVVCVEATFGTYANSYTSWRRRKNLWCFIRNIFAYLVVKYVRVAGLVLRLGKLRLEIKHSKNARNYINQALTPVVDGDLDELDMFNNSASSRAAGDKAKKCWPNSTKRSAEAVGGEQNTKVAGCTHCPLCLWAFRRSGDADVQTSLKKV